MTLNVPFLYEDNHVLVVDKPYGVLSQADLSGDVDMLTLVKTIIKSRDQKPGNVYLGLVHRLDRPVGGVMVIAKTSKAAGRLSEQFRERRAKKIYRAFVSGSIEPVQGELTHFLKKNKARVTEVVGPNRDGKEARLRYRVLQSGKDKSLVEIDLITGLPHQIRAQLCAIGHPVLGDRKYGSTAHWEEKGGIALFAYSITFEHPISKNEITVTAESTLFIG